MTSESVDALDSRLNAAGQATRALGERVNRPDFGVGLRALERDLAAIETEIAGLEGERR